MTAPGVGPPVSLTVRAGIDEAARFGRSRRPPHFGLTPARDQSGELDRERGAFQCGGAGVRWSRVKAAGIIMRQRIKRAPSKV
ncbi:transposase [Paracoccus hibiscisoli]